MKLSSTPTSAAPILGLVLWYPCLFQPGAVAGDGFLPRVARSEDVKNARIESVAALLRSESSGNITEAALQIETLLSPVFLSLPRDKHGKFDDASARYILHRLFLERHGWEFRLSPPAVDADTNMTKPSGIDIVMQHLPSNVQDYLESEFTGEGYESLELVLFGAAVEHVILEEVTDKLYVVYSAKSLMIENAVNKMQAMDLVDLFMASYITSYDLSSRSGAEVFKFQTSMPYAYNNWDQTRRFFRSIEESIYPDAVKYTFEDINRIVSQISKDFVHWNNHQCSQLKSQLMQIESRKSGRVRLLDFYNAAIYNGSTAFVESVEYLKDLGALDMSDPLEPRVMISNYLDGPSNCVARTTFYSVCCLDECADLFSHIEGSLQKPEATPEEILPIVESLQSASSATCTELPDTLAQRLHDIAKQNNGFVALHAPSFAEWMHFVYPRECVNGGLFGAAHELTMEEWEIKTHQRSSATEHELHVYSQHLGEMERARRLRKNNTDTEEWNIRESATWPKSEEPTVTGKNPGGVGQPSSDWLQLVPLFLGVAFLPAVVLKYLSRGKDSEQLLKSQWNVI